VDVSHDLAGTMEDFGESIASEIEGCPHYERDEQPPIAKLATKMT
jgi:hypothetical protein